jgi:hypothetical protein
MSVLHATPEELAEYERARRNVGVLAKVKAKEAAIELGFGWVGTPDAPNIYEDLVAAHERSRTYGVPLPISNSFCDNSVYGSVENNIALRYWHDTCHIRTGLTFALPDELALGLYHLWQVEDAGFKRESLEWRIIQMDLVGQNHFIGITGHFPMNQERFVRTAIFDGLDEAILAELSAMRD